MANDNQVIADPRSTFGKGVARKLRAIGKIPAVIYGRGGEPIHVSLPAHQTGLLIRKANALLDLQIDGKSHLVLVKDVQKDPVRQIIEHLDLVTVVRGEKVHVEVPVHLEGDPISGTNAEIETHTLSLEAEATHIPEYVTVNVDGLADGEHVYAKDVKLPSGSSLTGDPEQLIVAIHTKRAEVEEETVIAETPETPADAE